MKIFVVKTLTEDIDINSCDVELFTTEDAAQQYAKDLVEKYVRDNEGFILDNYPNHLMAQSGGSYITVDVEPHDFAGNTVEESKTPETLNGIPISEDRMVKVDWDIDDPEGEEEAYELPETVLVPRYVPDEDVADYLSDIWGFCINSWYEV